MKSWLRTEDGLAFFIGLALTATAALPMIGVDSFGWVVKTNVWLDPAAALTPGFALGDLLDREGQELALAQQ